MAAYGATFNIEKQANYDRTQVVIRILIVIILALIGGAIGWIAGLLYLAIPVLGAVMISQKGARRYLDEAPENMTKWLRYIIALYAYIGLLSDRLPTQDPAQFMRFDVTPTGEPTAGGTLVRIILAIPHAIVLGLLWIVAFVLLVIAGIMILAQQDYPEGIFNFLRGYLRWQARLFAYLAGLVAEYPPFALDTGPEPPALPGETPQPQAT